MKFFKFIKIMLMVTVLAIVYIHMQMNIIDLAYRGKVKEKEIRKLIEENGNLTYAILTLKSANNIGDRMLNEDSEMEFADPQNVVQILTPDAQSESEVFENEIEVLEEEQPLLGFLSWGKPAMAQTQPK